MRKPQGERQRLWRQTYPEKARDYNRQHYAAHKDRYKQKPSRYHGLTVDEIKQKLAAQGGGCAICDKTEPGGKGWHGDHDHVTGTFRAVLCTKCNMGIGLLNDDPRLTRRATVYLEFHAIH